jgi:hypothetical protein
MRQFQRRFDVSGYRKCRGKKLKVSAGKQDEKVSVAGFIASTSKTKLRNSFN